MQNLKIGNFLTFYETILIIKRNLRQKLIVSGSLLFQVAFQTRRISAIQKSCDMSDRRLMIKVKFWVQNQKASHFSSIIEYFRPPGFMNWIIILNFGETGYFISVDN
ncbi:hypothetical protein D1BOALGB6SA_1016 [Olavius sp. associated proteobacterium Delta 1]|nr:hypothetical protein D1BOALGB6SA_1016 [Olavius sp. associated proteobacterium Delta 1]